MAKNKALLLLDVVSFPLLTGLPVILLVYKLDKTHLRKKQNL